MKPRLPLFLEFFFLLFLNSVNAQNKSDAFFENILNKIPDSTFQMVYQQPEKYRVQIIYTQINRDKHNKPSFKNYYFHVNPNLYFNPASTVKMPLAFLALQKLHQIKKEGVNKYTTMLTDSAYTAQTKVDKDTTSEDGLPSIAQYIRKVFLVSDNDAYTRLYEFLGQQYINRSMHKMGYNDVRITLRFMPMTADENRHTNPIDFLGPNGKILYHQDAAFNKDSFDFSHIIKMGKGHWNNRDSLINEPIDFTRANNISLEDLQQIEQSVLFPTSVPKKQRFDLKKDDLKFLYKWMSQYPSETNYPFYDSSIYYNSFVKMYFKAGGHQLPGNIREFNKPGWAYGFLTDVAYIVDFKNNTEFMLSCTIYANENQILNDNHYEYEAVGYPFMLALQKAISQYELTRKRKYLPDLSSFKMNYDHRTASDRRKQIQEVAD